MRRLSDLKKDDQFVMRIPLDGAQADVKATASFKVLRRVRTGWQCQKLDDGSLQTFRRHEMMSLVKQRAIAGVDRAGKTFCLDLEKPQPADWRLFSAKQKERALARKRACDEFRRRYPRREKNANALEEFVADIRGKPDYPSRISPRTLQRWLECYQPNDPPTMLCDKPRASSRRLQPEVHAIVMRAIDRDWLRRRPQTRRAIHEQIVSAVDQRNGELLKASAAATLLRAPSYPTICRIIDDLDKFDVTSQQEGIKAAQEKFKIFGQSSLRFRAGELVVVDSTMLDINIILGNATKIKRPYLTIVQCVVTRIILGWHISIDRPCAEDIIAALLHAFGPKPSMQERYGGFVKNEFGFHGCAQGVLLDNARENQSSQVLEVLQAIGVQFVEFTPPADPAKKGQIERFFRTLNSALWHDLPGGVPYGSGAKPSYNPKGDACLTSADIERLLYKFCADIHPFGYLPHLRMPRIDAWLKDIPGDPPRPLTAEIRVAMMPRRFYRKITKEGIKYKGSYYGNDKELRAIRIRDGGKKYLHCCLSNPGDMSDIFIRDPSCGRYVKLSAREPTHIGAREWEVQAFLEQQNADRDAARRMQKAGLQTLRDDKRRMSKRGRQKAPARNAMARRRASLSLRLKRCPNAGEKPSRGMVHAAPEAAASSPSFPLVSGVDEQAEIDALRAELKHRGGQP